MTLAPSKGRRSSSAFWHTSAQAAIAVLVGTVACSSEPKVDEGSGGAGATASGTTAAGGAAGSPINLGGCENKDPAEVVSGEDCFYPCAGGANAWTCGAVTVELSEPVPAADIEVQVDTSLGESFTCDASCVDQDWEGTGPWLALHGDPVERLSVRTWNGEVYDPSWLDAVVDQSGSPIGSAHFDVLEYQCHDYSSDDWCWEAAPLELTVTPEP